MRNPLAAALLLVLAAPLARADATPEGTEPLSIYEGQSKQIQASNGSQIVCDDPGVAHGDIVGEKFLIVAGHAGTTLCGVRFNGAGRGVYLVTVKPAPEQK